MVDDAYAYYVYLISPSCRIKLLTYKVSEKTKALAFAKRISEEDEFPLEVWQGDNARARFYQGKEINLEKMIELLRKLKKENR